MKTSLTFRHPYDEETNAKIRRETDQDYKGEVSMTVQAPAADLDINGIVKRMGIKDGSIRPGDLGVIDPNYYGDFTNQPTTLKEALDLVNSARDRFMELPAEVRSRFANNPAILFDWIHDPSNLEEATRMGLLQEIDGSRPQVPTQPAKVNPPTPLSQEGGNT